MGKQDENNYSSWGFRPWVEGFMGWQADSKQIASRWQAKVF